MMTSGKLDEFTHYFCFVMERQLVTTCISESGGAELAHRVNFLSPVSISHMDTSLLPWTAEEN